MADIQKGKISTIEGPLDINGNCTRARVVTEDVYGIVTKPLIISPDIRGDAGLLTKGTEVIFAVFPDQSGIVLCRADGEVYSGLRIENGVLYVSRGTSAPDVFIKDGVMHVSGGVPTSTAFVKHGILHLS